MEKEYKMSQARKDELEQELNYLKTTRSDEVAEQIKIARGFGDLSENSEYDEAKNEQGKLYSKIAEMKVLIENAEIIEKTELDADTVSLSSHVKLLDVDEKDGELVFAQGSGTVPEPRKRDSLARDAELLLTNYDLGHAGVTGGGSMSGGAAD